MKLCHSIVLSCTFIALCGTAQAQDRPKKGAARSTAAVAAAPAAPVAVPEADAEQLTAAALTLFGSFSCAHDDMLVVSRSTTNAGYIDVVHGKRKFTMKPVRSETGAIRLEEVSGAMLMVQIPSKSMMMDTKLGQRVADACRNEEQKREVESADSLGISAPGQVNTAAAASPTITPRR